MYLKDEAHLDFLHVPIIAPVLEIPSNRKVMEIMGALVSVCQHA